MGLVQKTGCQATGGARQQAGCGWGGWGQAAGAGSSRRDQHVLRWGDVNGHGCACRREGPLQLSIPEKAWESTGQSAFLCDVEAAAARACSRCGSSIARGCQRKGLSVSVRERIFMMYWEQGLAHILPVFQPHFSVRRPSHPFVVP